MAQLLNGNKFAKFVLTIEILLVSCVILANCEDVNNCNSSGTFEKFPHCIGYWPPKYNPETIDVTNTDLYIPTMSANVEDLKQSSRQQKHTIQVSILLPHTGNADSKYSNVSLAPAQERSGIGILVGFRTIRELKLIRDDILFNITLRDSRCDSTYGLKSFLDAFSEGVHVLFGPSCDLSLGKLI
jgi:hypothetical protein